MGSIINPADLTTSGERCLERLLQLSDLELPAPQLVTAIGTVVERHVGSILAMLIARSEVQSSAIGLALVAKVEESMNSTWPNRKDWLRDGFDISYSGDAIGQSFDTLIELRNSIVHGDGALSDQQQRKMKIPSLIALRKRYLKHFAVEFRGRLRYAPDSGPKAMDAARTFVAHFDRLVIEKYPDVRSF